MRKPTSGLQKTPKRNAIKRLADYRNQRADYRNPRADRIKDFFQLSFFRPLRWLEISSFFPAATIPQKLPLGLATRFSATPSVYSRPAIWAPLHWAPLHWVLIRT